MEEKEIERCKQLIKVEHANWIGISNQLAIKRLLENYKQDEKVIQAMAEYTSTKNYADDICEFRYDVKGRFHKHCYKGECKQCIIDYFRKKCK